jgi:hypothetical protein
MGFPDMLTREQARELVAREVCGPFGNDDELIFIDEHTIERAWGWMFFYTSRKWHETGDVMHAVAGNAPILVERESGRLITTGTARSPEHYLQNYERCGDPHG